MKLISKQADTGPWYIQSICDSCIHVQSSWCCVCPGGGAKICIKRSIRLHNLDGYITSLIWSKPRSYFPNSVVITLFTIAQIIIIIAGQTTRFSIVLVIRNGFWPSTITTNIRDKLWLIFGDIKKKRWPNPRLLNGINDNRSSFMSSQRNRWNDRGCVTPLLFPFSRRLAAVGLT